MSIFFISSNNNDNDKTSIKLLLILTILLIQVPSIFSETKEYDISITYEPLKDFPERMAIHGNGQHPLPTIICHPGDLIKLTMENNIKHDNNNDKKRDSGSKRRNVSGGSNGRRRGKRAVVDNIDSTASPAIEVDLIDSFTLHFHGILQNSNDYNTTQIFNGLSDGVPFITQPPTKPGETFSYQFTVANDQKGTFFYHSHWDLSSITGHGAFIVKDDNPPADYGKYEEQQYGQTTDEPFIILFSDLWAENDQDLVRGLLDPINFTFVGQPSDILINGDVSGNTVFLVEPSKTYRIRIIGATTLEDIVFGITDHQMTVIEVDGSYVKPKTVDTLEVSSGQRYSVLVTADKTPNDYNILGEIRLRDDITTSGKNATATLRYVTNAINTPTTFSSTTSSSTTFIPTATATPVIPSSVTPISFEMLTTATPMPKQSDRTIVLVSQQLKIPTSDNTSIVRWNVNGKSYEDFPTPILADLLSGARSRVIDWSALDGNGFDPTRKTYPIKDKEVIDLVFQNSVGPAGSCDYHPWHLHGHGFWELAYGNGAYPGEFNVTDIPENPAVRDTTTVYPNPQGSGLVPDTKCGWKLVRFVADNPGAWAVHCHITSHALMGLMFVFEEAIEKLPLISSNRQQIQPL